MLHEIRWKDVDLDEAPYDVQCFPTSQLPDSPTGRIETISEYIDKEWITKSSECLFLTLIQILKEKLIVKPQALDLRKNGFRKWLKMESIIILNHI